jgi:hypothetical protein
MQIKQGGYRCPFGTARLSLAKDGRRCITTGVPISHSEIFSAVCNFMTPRMKKVIFQGRAVQASGC